MSTVVPFVRFDDAHLPAYGEVVEVMPGLQRVVAENPNKFTYVGTGTYIVGDRDVVVIDPGPRLDTHRDALAAALQGRRVRAIAVTHCHADHSPLAAWLRAETGAPTVAFGPHGDVGEDEVDDGFEDEPDADGSQRDAPVEETTDIDFMPDIAVVDGELAADLPGLTLRAVHTPGHTSNHTCFAWEQAQVLFTGDHVMGWSTTVVAPPNGDMRAYMASLAKVAGRDDRILVPTHGVPVTEPRPFVTALLEHRREREAAILAEVRAGRARVADIVRVLYVDVRPELHRAAGRSVRAHLIKLADDGLVVVDGGTWRPV